MAVGLKFRLGYDDSLDVVGVHLVGGLVGTLLIGFFADPASPAGETGLFLGGGVDLLAARPRAPQSCSCTPLRGHPPLSRRSSTGPWACG